VSVEYFFPHTEQLNGFSPVCVRMCTLTWFGVANDFSHKSHGCFLFELVEEEDEEGDGDIAGLFGVGTCTGGGGG